MSSKELGVIMDSITIYKMPISGQVTLDMRTEWDKECWTEFAKLRESLNGLGLAPDVVERFGAQLDAFTQAVECSAFKNGLEIGIALGGVGGQIEQETAPD